MTILEINLISDQILKVEKRNRFEIYYDILNSLQIQISVRERVSFTLAASQANLPYNRFQKALALLIRLGLCNIEGDKFIITEKGEEYLEEYRKINEFFKRMGFYA